MLVSAVFKGSLLNLYLSYLFQFSLIYYQYILRIISYFPRVDMTIYVGNAEENENKYTSVLHVALC